MKRLTAPFISFKPAPFEAAPFEAATVETAAVKMAAIKTTANRTAVNKTVKLRAVATLVIVGVIWSTGAVSGSAQGLDDLFTRPTDARFSSPSDDEPMGSPNLLRESGQDRSADQRLPQRRVDRIPTSDRDSRPVPSPSDLKLVDRPSGSSERTPLGMTAMEIRQARSLEETRQRTARLEAARWAGGFALRPSWNPDPMTGSRFPNRNVMRVPIYIRNR